MRDFGIRQPVAGLTYANGGECISYHDLKEEGRGEEEEGEARKMQREEGGEWERMIGERSDPRRKQSKVLCDRMTIQSTGIQYSSPPILVIQRHTSALACKGMHADLEHTPTWTPLS